MVKFGVMPSVLHTHIKFGAGHGFVALFLLVLVFVHLVAVLLAHPGFPLLCHLCGGLRAALVGALFGSVVAFRRLIVVEFLRAGGAVSRIRRVQNVALLVWIVHVVRRGVVLRVLGCRNVSAVDDSALTDIVPLSVFGEQQSRIFVRWCRAVFFAHYCVDT